MAKDEKNFVSLWNLQGEMRDEETMNGSWLRVNCSWLFQPLTFHR